MHSTNITVKDKVYYNDFVDKWKKDYVETLNKNCCKRNCCNIIDDFVSFGISTDRRDLYDYTLIETINGKEVKYAIEVKYSYNSGDSNTNREIVNSAIYLEYLGYKPIMLIRSENNLEKIIKGFENSGWDVRISKDAFDFIKQKAKFNEDSFCLEGWIEENIDIWDVVKDYENELEKINHTKEKWKF